MALAVASGKKLTNATYEFHQELSVVSLAQNTGYEFHQELSPLL